MVDDQLSLHVLIRFDLSECKVTATVLRYTAGLFKGTLRKRNSQEMSKTNYFMGHTAV